MNVWLSVALITLAAILGAATWEIAVTQPAREAAEASQTKLALIGGYMGALRTDLNALAGNKSGADQPLVILAEDLTNDPFFVAMNRIAYDLGVPAPTAVADLSRKVHGQ
jgi:hypothetical protein